MTGGRRSLGWAAGRHASKEAMDSLERTLAEIRSKAAELRNSFGDEERARANRMGSLPG